MEVPEAFATDVYMIPEIVLITPLPDHYLAGPISTKRIHLASQIFLRMRNNQIISA